jgi:plastocyanin
MPTGQDTGRLNVLYNLWKHPLLSSCPKIEFSNLLKHTHQTTRDYFFPIHLSTYQATDNMLKTLLFTVIAASQATAATIKINAAQNGLTFTPNTVTAQVGDVLEYHFFGGAHSVVQGDFTNPCKPVSSGGFFSGFMPVSAGEGVRTQHPPSTVHMITLPSTLEQLTDMFASYSPTSSA